MNSAALCLLLLIGAPEEPADPGELDELIAMQIAVRAAAQKVSPSVVTILTTGGIRHIEIPANLKKPDNTPGRPRDARRPVPEDGGGKNAPGGKKAPHFENPWQKMLAPPGFKKAEGPSTGVIVSKDGYIVTSAWNFESKPNSIVVSLADGTSHAATLLGIDRAAGLALLKIDTGTKLIAAETVPSKDVHVGAWALAIGRALSHRTVEIKSGIISARDRIDGKALQTDAATSPTNYGGPLIDIEGRVYGIIVPLGARGQEANPSWYDSGVGFAVPYDSESLVKRLGKRGTELLPAVLGVTLNQDRTKPGALLTGVAPDSGAEKAGLKKDDLITSIDGTTVKNAFTLRFAIGRKRAGDKVTLVIERGSEKISVEVTLTERPKPTDDSARLPVAMPGNRGKPKDRGQDGGSGR